MRGGSCSNKVFCDVVVVVVVVVLEVFLSLLSLLLDVLVGGSPNDKDKDDEECSGRFSL